MTASALFLRRGPEGMGNHAHGNGLPETHFDTNHKEISRQVVPESGIALTTAVRTRTLWILIWTYLLLNFSLQMIMVHLINYATDVGVPTLVAATFLSAVGIASIAGRLAMGSASDKIGSRNALLICCIVVVVSLSWLIFASEIWMFYLFAIVFGFAYGGEITQMATLIGHFFGLRAVSALIGTLLFGGSNRRGSGFLARRTNFRRNTQLPDRAHNRGNG